MNEDFLTLEHRFPFPLKQCLGGAIQKLDGGQQENFVGMLALINKDLIPRLLETRCVICKRLDDARRKKLQCELKCECGFLRAISMTVLRINVLRIKYDCKKNYFSDK